MGEFFEQDRNIVLVCCLEIVALLGPQEVSFKNVKIIVSIMLETNYLQIQEKCFLALIQLDYPGLFALIDIANRDHKQLSFFILNKLANIQEIQINVIVPSLMADVQNGLNKKKVQAMAALNRMGHVVFNQIDNLIQIFEDGNIDRQLTASTILCSGGRVQLLRILNQTKNSKIKQAIISILGQRLSDYQKPNLDIEINDQYVQTIDLNPGFMCSYEGQLNPQFFDQQNYENKQIKTINIQKSKISIASRDFLAALQRLLALNYENFQYRSLQVIQQARNIYNQKIENQFVLLKVLGNEEQSQSFKIQRDVIHALSNCLHDKDSSVKESALNTLGLIGMPEAMESIQTIIERLSDQDSSVKAMAAWCIGKLGPQASKIAGQKLIPLLKDKFWKVRTSSCLAISCLGEKYKQKVFSALISSLKDSSISKQIVCETMVKLGSEGEKILIDILKNLLPSNASLKTAIINSFQQSNMNKTVLDFIIEEIFKNSRDECAQVRKACLNTLEALRNKQTSDEIHYLKPKNIIPFFYFYLQDKDKEIRHTAMKNIVSFGAQAELIFIEGLTKDKNKLIRQECAKGLAELGPQTFKALLFGLRDKNDEVRNATAQAILNNFDLDIVLNEYRNQQNQFATLHCQIQEILEANHIMYVSEEVRILLQQIMDHLQEQSQNYIQNSPQSNDQEIQFDFLRKNIQKQKDEYIKQQYDNINENEEYYNNNEIVIQDLQNDTNRESSQKLSQHQQQSSQFQQYQQQPLQQQYSPKNYQQPQYQQQQYSPQNYQQPQQFSANHFKQPSQNYQQNQPQYDQQSQNQSQHQQSQNQSQHQQSQNQSQNQFHNSQNQSMQSEAYQEEQHYIKVLVDIQNNDPSQFEDIMQNIRQQNEDQYQQVMEKVEEQKEFQSQIALLKELKINDIDMFNQVIGEIRNENQEQAEIILQEIQ